MGQDVFESGGMMYKSATLVVGAVVGLCSLGACQSPGTGPAAAAVEPTVELLGGSYRKSDAHWFAVTKGALLSPADGGGYCGATSAAKVQASGSFVCFYGDGGQFDRVVVYSHARALAQFVLRDPLPFRRVAPATWPVAAAQL